MSEQTGTAPQPPATDNTAASQASDEMLHASEAAAEHTLTEPGNELLAEADRLRGEVAAWNDKYLRLHADFDNFRKRTAKEKMELLQFAGENALKNFLPVLDDMERAIAYNESADDLAAVKQGFSLIHQKLTGILGAQGVRIMTDVKGQPLDVDRHEAITKAPAPGEDMKGKVIDVLENGYTMHDKVIRFAKVVVGE